MFGNREVHRKLSGSGGYAAERLAEISESLGQLAKVMKNSGGEPGLSREDGKLRSLRPETGMPEAAGWGELLPLLSAPLF